MKKYILAIFFALSTTLILAQEYTTRNKKAIEYYRQTENFMIRRQYPQAIQLLEMALEKDEKFAEAHQALANCYQALNDYDRAMFHYRTTTQLQAGNRRFMLSYFGLAELSFKKGMYAEAIPLVEQYLEFQPPRQNMIDDANRLLRDARYSIEAIKDSIPFNPRPVAPPINQLPLQYFPVLTANGKQLIFTGRKGFGAMDDEDIYISQKIGETWGDPGSISSDINTVNNEGTCTISADGRILIFTSCNGRSGYGSCDLFITKKVGDLWSKPVNLGSTVNSRAWDSQPSLSQDGRTLFFVSNRKGGLGLRDIWVTTLDDNGLWREPVNLGPGINTKDDEISPFIHPDNQTLYFASKGYPGFGGFDLYRTERSQQGWTKPENLGYPLNSSDDQVSLFVTTDGEVGMYSFEKRYNTLNYSYLYEFDVPEEISVSKKSTYVYGQVFDASNNKPLKSSVELKSIKADERVALVDSDSINGNYLIVLTEGAEYALYAEKHGYLFKSYSFNYADSAGSQPVRIDIYLEPITKDGKVVLKNLFFDFDQADLQEKSLTELEKIMAFLEDNPEVKIEISGHTDDSGNPEYNRDLSLRRARTVYDFLVEKGVAPERLRYRGYGEAEPLAPNDSESNKQLNRRIEFKIL